MQTVNLSKYVEPGRQRVRILPSGPSGMAYQLVTRVHVPETGKATPGEKAIEIETVYDRTSLAVGGVLNCRVTVRYNREDPAFMVIVDLGIPPGFEPLAEDFEALVRAGTLDRFALQPRQATLYLGWVGREKPVQIEYRLRARYPVKAAIPPSKVYEYYNPDVRDEGEAGKIEVK
ncbi:MAG: hypothetical protein ACYTHM_17675 [Planctomycetota bacterium]